ncbi:hypothetical protein [Streptomyces sp. NPDC090798]|uniref:hypothetical protein n=1 Tax=Streptomyces sp. NPDC090798 TaxID=3365968 RepID=UPI00382F9062
MTADGRPGRGVTRSCGKPLLLVGYFDCTCWNTKKRRCLATDHDIDDVRREQHEQVRQLTHDSTLLAAAHVLDCRLPGEDSEWRKMADKPQ